LDAIIVSGHWQARTTMFTQLLRHAANFRLERRAARNGHAAARQDAFFDGRARRMQASSTRALRSFISLSVAHDVDLGSAGSLATVFPVFFVVIAGGIRQSRGGSIQCALDFVALAGAFDDVVCLCRRSLPWRGKSAKVRLSQLGPKRRHRVGASQSRQCLRSIALRRHDRGLTAKLGSPGGVYPWPGFAFDFLGNDQQRFAGVNHLSARHDFLDVGNLLFVNQHKQSPNSALHLLWLVTK